MSTSPHKRWKGCQLCKPWKFQDQLRKMGKKRYGRHELPDGA